MMTRVAESPTNQAVTGPTDMARAPRELPFDAPWVWLAAGWRDMWTIPWFSLGYGAIFAACAALLALGLWSQAYLSLFLALAGGFLLVGPVFGAGLYAASEKLALGQPVRWRDMLAAALGARGQLLLFGGILLMAFLFWLELALLLAMLFLGTRPVPPAGEFMATLLFTGRGVGLLVTGTMAGAIIAALVFAMSVFAAPSLMVLPIDAVTAARRSVHAVVLNPKPLALWAFLIVMLIAAGFATLLVGLAVAFPLIGHATWHAYTDTFGEKSDN